LKGEKKGGRGGPAVPSGPTDPFSHRKGGEREKKKRNFKKERKGKKKRKGFPPPCR